MRKVCKSILCKLYLRELFYILNSSSFYLFAFVFLLLSGFFFSGTFFLSGQADFSSLSETVPALLMLFIPALCMKSFSEEFKSGTYETLSSLPASEEEVSLAKYGAILSSALLTLLPFSVYTSLLYALGKPDSGAVAGFFIASFLLISFFCAVSLFFSSITSSQLTAFLFSLLLLLILYLCDKAAMFAPLKIQKIFSAIGFMPRFSETQMGLINIDSLFYFISLSVFFVYISFLRLKVIRCPESAGKMLSRGAAALLITLCLNLFFSAIPFHFDITDEKIYSVSKAAREQAAGLSDNLVIEFFRSENLPSQINTEAGYEENFLREYSRTSKRIKVEKIIVKDESSRQRAIRTGIAAVRFDVVEREKFQQSEGFLGFALKYMDKKEVIPFLPQSSFFEYELVSAVKKLTQKSKRKLYLISDYGFIPEFIPEGTRRAIENIYELHSARAAELIKADENSCLLIIGPQKPIPEKDLAIIESYILSGHKAFLALDVKNADIRTMMSKDNYTGLERFLEINGIKIRNYLVLDESSQNMQLASRQGSYIVSNTIKYYPLIRVSSFDRSNPVTRNMSSFTMPFASPIEISSTTPLSVLPLAYSSRLSWIKTSQKYHSINPLSSAMEISNEDEKGPFILAALINGKFIADYNFLSSQGIKKNPQDSADSSVILFSGSKFIYSRTETDFENASVFLNSLDLLNDERLFLKIRDKGSIYRPLREIPADKKMALKYFSFLLPLFMVLAGAVYSWARRVRKTQEAVRRFSK